MFADGVNHDPQINISSAYVAMMDDQLLIGEPPKVNENREQLLRVNTAFAIFCAAFSFIAAAIDIVICSTSGRPTFLASAFMFLLNYTTSLLVIWRIYPELTGYAGTTKDYRADATLNYRERQGSLMAYASLVAVGLSSGFFGVYSIASDIDSQERGWMLGWSFVLASMSFGIFKVKEIYRKDLCSTVVRADTFCWSATVLISSMLFITGTLESLLPGLWWLDCVGSIGIGWLYMMRYGVTHFQNIFRSTEWAELEPEEELESESIV